MTLSRFEGIGCKSVSRQKTELQQDLERIRNQERRQTDQTRQTGEHSAVHKKSSWTDPGHQAGTPGELRKNRNTLQQAGRP